MLPAVLAIPAMAQDSTRLAQRIDTRATLPRGTQIEVFAENERVIVTPEETTSLRLTVAENVRDRQGIVVIPAGSIIEGELRPARSGTQFFAQEVILRGTNERLALDADSNIVTRRQVVSRRTNPDVLRGAAVGSAAAAVVAEVFGRIDFVDVLAGAGLGVLGELLLTRQREVEVVVVFPETDLDLQLTSDFEVLSGSALRPGDGRDVRDTRDVDVRRSDDGYFYRDELGRPDNSESRSDAPIRRVNERQRLIDLWRSRNRVN
jgi:hypothetical protein